MTENIEQINYTSVDNALRGRNHGVFINNNGEYCEIHSSYFKNTKNIFANFYTDKKEKRASRFAIRTVSEKKIVKMLNTEKFKLIETV